MSYLFQERMDMTWSPDSDGGTVWLDGDVQELIDDARAPGESPNQALNRILGDGTHELEILSEEDVRDIAWDVIEEAKHR